MFRFSPGSSGLQNYELDAGFKFHVGPFAFTLFVWAHIFGNVFGHF